MAATIAGSAGPCSGTRSGTGAVATWVVGCQWWGCQGIGSGFEMVQLTRR